MNSNIEHLSMSIPLSVIPNPSQKYRGKRRIIIKTGRRLRRLSTINELEVYSPSSSASSHPDKNGFLKIPDSGN